MPLHEPWIGLILRAVREFRMPVRKQNFANAVDVVDLAGQQNAPVLGHSEQASIEHPMHCAGQGESVLDNVWSPGAYRFDMRSFDLGSATTVDELKSSERAAAIISLQYNRSENAVLSCSNW
jgi:hypothetical protein